MKVQLDNTKTTASEQFEAHVMGIAPEHMSHIFKLLTETYQNPELAVIREYAANAIDAHTEAGIKKAIRVTLPTSLSPNLVIQDWGVGLSKDDIVRVYSQYGASTKRDTNEQIGGFGIGAKSAFTVSDQFTVVGIQNKIKTSVLFTRTDKGGEVKIISEVPTDEPNGVTVQIPIKEKFAKFADEAKQLFYAWEKDEIELRGADLENYQDEYTELADGIYMQEKRGGVVYLRMGRIVYSLDRDCNLFADASKEAGVALNRMKQARLNMILDAPIGSLDLVPSRDNLMASKRTAKTISTLLEAADKLISARYQKELKSQPDLISTLKYLRTTKDATRIYCQNATYRGKPLPTEPGVSFNFIRARSDHYNRSISKETINFNDYEFLCVSNPQSNHHNRHNYNTPRWDSSSLKLLIIDTSGEEFKKYEDNDPLVTALTDRKRGRICRALKSYLAQNTDLFETTSYSADVFIMLQEQVKGDPLIASLDPKIIKAKEIFDAAKADRAAGRTKDKSVAYCVLNEEKQRSSKRKTVYELADYKRVFYIQGRELSDKLHSLDYYYSTYKDFAKLPDDSVIVVLQGSQKVSKLTERLLSVSGATPEDYMAYRIDLLQKEIATFSKGHIAHLERTRPWYDNLSDYIPRPTKLVYTHIVAPFEAGTYKPRSEKLQKTLVNLTKPVKPNEKKTPTEAVKQKPTLANFNYKYNVNNGKESSRFLAQLEFFRLDLPPNPNSIAALIQEYPIMRFVAEQMHHNANTREEALRILDEAIYIQDQSK